MISASGIELRAGARVLIESATFRIAKGDRIGLVGRTRRRQDHPHQGPRRPGHPAGGTVTRSGEVGYLPQGPPYRRPRRPRPRPHPLPPAASTR
ncbi:hypothetical protein GCM10023238_01930 [Streptomyces heliomycini]